MTGTATRRQLELSPASADEQQIQHCLKGNQEAWAALIDKYKNLVYSIPIRLGMHQDAADIFQSVCLDLLSQLGNLREHRALPKWLMQTCYHKCLRWQRTASRHAELDPVDAENQHAPETLPEPMLLQLERDQMLRGVIAESPERCSRMIQMLFFEIPPRPYHVIASELGLATGSIGFIRGRCLARLRKQLESRGF